MIIKPCKYIHVQIRSKRPKISITYSALAKYVLTSQKHSSE